MSDNGHNPGHPFDAQGKEMSLLGPEPELAEFARDVRAAFVRPLHPSVSERHVAAMLVEAERMPMATAGDAVSAQRLRPRTPAPRGWLIARRLAVVALATFGLGAGLALAGVRPPEPISDALEGLGVDVPGSDEDSGQAGDKRSRGHARERESSSAGETAPAASSGGNSANDGETPGAGHANENASEGQRTATQARSGETPPEAPGQSDTQPQPSGNGTPPEDPGSSEIAPKGKPDSPPGEGHGRPAGAAGLSTDLPDADLTEE